MTPLLREVLEDGEKQGPLVLDMQLRIQCLSPLSHEPMPGWYSALTVDFETWKKKKKCFFLREFWKIV